MVANYENDVSSIDLNHAQFLYACLIQYFEQNIIYEH